MLDEQIKLVLDKVIENIKRNRYDKLSPADSQIARHAYLLRLNLPSVGSLHFYNTCDTLVAAGYNRIVVGDYGAYIEFTPEQVQLKNIENRWPGKPERKVKYIWMQTNDDDLTKVYLQKRKVDYADYQPGMYYVSPAYLFIDGKKLYEPIVGDTI